MPAPVMLYAKRHPSDNTIVILAIPDVCFTHHSERTTHTMGSESLKDASKFRAMHSDGLIDDPQVITEILGIRGVKRVCMERYRLELHANSTSGHLKIVRSARAVLDKLVDGNLALNHAGIG